MPSASRPLGHYWGRSGCKDHRILVWCKVDDVGRRVSVAGSDTLGVVAGVYCNGHETVK